MALELTTDNEAKALKCLLANNPSNEAGVCGSDENTMKRLQRKLHGATVEEVHALIHTMEKDHIIEFTNLSSNEFTYDVHFLENYEKGQKSAQSGRRRFVITTIVALAMAVIAFLALFKP